MAMKSSVYINAIGKYLPGKPIGNEEMEAYLGMINGQPSRSKTRMLTQNGIKKRYYALNKNQESTESVAGMTVKAIDDCFGKANLSQQAIQFLSAGTTQGDLPIPGFASMVHGASTLPICEITSHQSVCTAGMMAIKSAFLNVQSGQIENAVACAGELASRMFKAKRFEGQDAITEKGSLPLDTDFLRWMLSDGAGAFLIQDKPDKKTISLEIEWIDLKSHATDFEPCMYTGMNKTKEGEQGPSWIDFDSFSAADRAGAINLKQDIRLVNNIVGLGVQHFFNLVDAGKIDTKSLDWFLCHYSSEYFKQPILDLLQKGGVEIPEEKWFTNLHSKGNTGSASIFIMLEELLYKADLKDGQQILCMVPESGRFITSFMMLKVVAPSETKKELPLTYEDEIIAPTIATEGRPIQEKLVRGLTSVWVDFEKELRHTPIIEKIYNGTITLEEYRLLLLNLRQQVVDGSQWIARAASNVSMEYFDVRSSFISHSRDEHRDYQLLEKNYINCGGDKNDLYAGEKNIGSEALSAYMFHTASKPNPFDLLGAMFIIEGLGNRIAGKWGRAVQQLLNLTKEQVSFFTYHEISDSNENHFERFENAINSDALTEELAKKILKSAKVVAKLYRMQLAEIGNY
ncbi:3-oxoacyl-[acyl-carrier-protein] synthase-3 [Flagellimonas meridianipacifica]|uniref:3-oxoacyl-[acyl-carrier-protein] synthase-3 n=2 Tax=Flagellimonas meridianipacifica TaxID=1080225 RepID=A0A2T0M8J5_9FLAO|nr:3-oxoacyl-[acyl-carrier-protein] synthase-3 [Allomuricauda pacifica]